MFGKDEVISVGGIAHTNAWSVEINGNFLGRVVVIMLELYLARNALPYNALDAIEFNEAFAVIDVLFEREHSDCIDKFNQLGGALAYGHPYGASGAILMIHLLAALKGGFGLLSIAGAGGTGDAILIER